MIKTAIRLFTVLELSLVGIAHAGTMGMQVDSWTGFYLGANGGGGWGDPTYSMTYLENGQLQSGVTWFPTKVTQHFSGAIFGGQIGYNYQLMPQLVLGLKYDTDLAEWRKYNHTPSGDSIGNIAEMHAAQQLTWFGHLLPRLGYLINDHFLLYGTGGLVFGNIKGYANQEINNINTEEVNYIGSFKKTTTGWTAGAGLECKMMEHWSVSLEYLYNDLGSHTAIADQTFSNGVVSTVFQNQYVFNNNFQTLALGVNYNW